MIHKLLEKWFDTILYVGIIVGIMGFFCFYWGNEYSFRYAKAVLQEFLDETSISGKITQEEYDGLKKRLQDTAYSEGALEMYVYKYSVERIYDLIPIEKWEKVFSEKNVRQPVIFQMYEPQIQQPLPSQLNMQTETNASILAADQQAYLPLPQEEDTIFIRAVREVQEVYEGEELITLCRVEAFGKVYYKEAEFIKAYESGEVLLELTLENNKYPVPVEVVCYPRTELCEEGHLVVNTKDVLEEKKLTGKIKCPYCKVIPSEISCTASVVNKKTGETWDSADVSLRVTYLDGSTEYVTPDSADWQDDFDAEYCGVQNVTIRYRNVGTVTTVLSENPLCQKCGEECNDRCYKDYVKYPYCVKCLSGMYLYTGQSKEEEQLITEKDLLYELDRNGELLFNRGDFIMITYKHRNNITILQQNVKINGKSGKNK